MGVPRVLGCSVDPHPSSPQTQTQIQRCSELLPCGLGSLILGHDSQENLNAFRWGLFLSLILPAGLLLDRNLALENPQGCS